MSSASPRSSLRGFSLTETAIVLAIVGIILSGVWIVANNAHESARVQAAAEAITTTVSNVRSYYAGQAGVPATSAPLLTKGLVNSNVISSSVSNVGWTYNVCNWTYGPVGGSTTCTNPAAPAATSPFFAFEFTGVPNQACIALVEDISGPTGPTGLVEVNINGTNLLESPAATPIQPVPTGVATTDCAAVANGVRFVYRVRTPTP